MKNLTRLSVFTSTAIEVFDLSVFAFLIPVLSSVFFSSHPQGTAIKFTVLAYIVSYVVKPFSGVLCGYMSDKYGRKQVLSSTTLIMTISTALIGLLPTTLPNIDLWVVLFVCRIAQGIAISGEFSTGIILAVEYGDKRPAFSGSLAFMGGIFGLLLANASVYLLLYALPHHQMLSFGWRIPFMISAVIWFCLFNIRKFISETNTTPRMSHLGFIALLTKHKKELAICFVSASLSASAFYITFIYMPTILTSVTKSHTHTTSIGLSLMALLLYFLLLPFFGASADKFGIKKQLSVAAILYLIFAYTCFAYIGHLNHTLIFCCLMVLSIIQAIYNAALPAFMVSLFPSIHRGKALAISYNSSLAIFGGLMPYIMLSRVTFSNPGIVISSIALLTIVSLRLVRS